MSNNPLGKKVNYTTIYTPSLLYPLMRADSRQLLGLSSAADIPFKGFDIWNCYEVSWLNRKGKPEVGVLELWFPSDSSRMVESKSVKLYLNSLSGTRFNTRAEVVKTVESDLSVAAQSPVVVKFVLQRDTMEIKKNHGVFLDQLDIDMPGYDPDPTLLSHAPGQLATELLYTDLFKTNCPVTGQPDWASVYINYRGKPIEHSAMLRYLVSYRNYEGFHESSVERIFMDIYRHLKPEQLTVYARYTRRGGIDINPYRSNYDFKPLNQRTFRQ